MILDAAIEFFAERGFAAQTRELAERLGISEPLIYRYFPTKDALIQRVFQEVIESRWDVEWATLLRDRRVPLRERLVDFYQRYLDAIDDAIWIRIVMYASLDGLDMTRHYITGHVDDVMGIIATEVSASMELEQEIDRELMWGLQSTLIYYLVRKHIHVTPVAQDRSAVVAIAVNAFVDGLPVRTASARNKHAADHGRPSAATRATGTHQGESTA
jgi:AcrR family transcriptional regulator